MGTTKPKSCTRYDPTFVASTHTALSITRVRPRNATAQTWPCRRGPIARTPATLEDLLLAQAALRVQMERNAKAMRGAQTPSTERRSQRVFARTPFCTSLRRCADSCCRCTCKRVTCHVWQVHRGQGCVPCVGDDVGEAVWDRRALVNCSRCHRGTPRFGRWVISDGHFRVL